MSSLEVAQGRHVISEMVAEGVLEDDFFKSKAFQNLVFDRLFYENESAGINLEAILENKWFGLSYRKLSDVRYKGQPVLLVCAEEFPDRVTRWVESGKVSRDRLKQRIGRHPPLYAALLDQCPTKVMGWVDDGRLTPRDLCAELYLKPFPMINKKLVSTEPLLRWLELERAPLRESDLLRLKLSDGTPVIQAMVKEHPEKVQDLFDRGVLTETALLFQPRGSKSPSPIQLMDLCDKRWVLSKVESRMISAKSLCRLNWMPQYNFSVLSGLFEDQEDMSKKLMAWLSEDPLLLDKNDLSVMATSDHTYWGVLAVTEPLFVCELIKSSRDPIRWLRKMHEKGESAVLLLLESTPMFLADLEHARPEIKGRLITFIRQRPFGRNPISILRYLRVNHPKALEHWERLRSSRIAHTLPGLERNRTAADSRGKQLIKDKKTEKSLVKLPRL